jgi:hypothetical protein
VKFRTFNAACYLVTGIVLLAIEAKAGWDIKVTLLALAAIAYAGWVGLTKRSYWYGGLSYTVPILALIYGFVVMTQS